MATVDRVAASPEYEVCLADKNLSKNKTNFSFGKITSPPLTRVDLDSPEGKFNCEGAVAVQVFFSSLRTNHRRQRALGNLLTQVICKFDIKVDSLLTVVYLAISC